MKGNIFLTLSLLLTLLILYSLKKFKYNILYIIYWHNYNNTFLEF